MNAFQISIRFPSFTSRCEIRFLSPINSIPCSQRKLGSAPNVQILKRRELVWRERLWLMNKNLKRERVVLVQGFGFNGGNGNDESNNTARVVGNLVLAIGLAYLSLTGQLGWLLDAIVSIWIFAVLLPVVGLGAFLWFVGRDIVQGTCPNCGNDFQIFKSSLKDGQQLCPFCSQPFTVKGDEFVRESAKFSNGQHSRFGQPFSEFLRRGPSEKGKASVTVVDVEAEVKDID